MKILGWCLALCLFLSWPVHADEVRWKQLLQEGAEAQQRGDLGSAEGAFQSALRMVESGDAGLSDIPLAVSLAVLAKHYEDRGQSAKAEPLLRRLLATYEQALGPDHPEVARILNSLGGLLQDQGRLSEAESLFQRALAIREKALDPDHLEVAISLVNLALVLTEQGRYSEAEPLNRRALVIREKAYAPDHPEVAQSLNNLASLRAKQGIYEEAELLSRRALAIREKAYGPDHPLIAISLENLAGLFMEQGRYNEAEPLNRRALEIFEKSLGSEHPYVARSLNNFAVLLAKQGRLSEAVSMHLRALTIQEKVYGPDHPDLAASLSNLAVLLIKEGLFKEAASTIYRLLAIQVKVFGPDHPYVAKSLDKLAQLLAYQGRHDEAEPLFRRALKIVEQFHGTEHPDVAFELFNLANLLGTQGRYDEAEPVLRRAMEIEEKMLGPDHPDHASSIMTLAMLMKLTGRVNDALLLARRASTIPDKRIPAQVKPVAGDVPERKQWRNAYAAHATIAISAMQAAPLAERPALLSEAFIAAQKATADSTADVLAQMTSRMASGNDALAREVRERQDGAKRWQQLDKQLLDMLSKPKDQRIAAEERQLHGRIADTEIEIRQQDEKLQRDFPDYRELIAPVPLSVVDAQKLLAADEGLLYWLVLKDETWLFLVRKDRAELVRIEPGHKQLSMLIKRLRLSTEIPPVGVLPPFPHGQAHELYQLILGPMEKHLDGIKHLILVPNGPLQSLSFGMLLTSATQKDTQAQETPWLARRYALITLPGVTSLHALQRITVSETGREPFIGFGDPILKGSRDDTRGVQTSKLFSRGVVADTDAVAELQPLPETAEELRRIATVLKAPASSIHLGRNATETKVKESPLAQYRIVAFATHGLMAGEFKGMAEPALVFTPPSTGSVQDDGLLTASEVAGLKLNADWVILSACNTAAPDGTPGADGFSGLTKAFFYAGARSLLVSHWAVESKSAAEITTRLFSETSKGLSKSEALGKAMMALADQPETSHPAYWAPFVIVGDGR